MQNDPDVLAIQEVESLEALIQFNRKYFDNMHLYMIVVDGNNPRQIDVGLISRFDFEAIRTHRFEPPKSPPWRRTFSRDCLEVKLRVGEEERLSMLVNHFKSEIGGGEERGREQAERVAEILKHRFGDPLERNFVVVRDLNAGPEVPEFRSLMSLKPDRGQRGIGSLLRLHRGGGVGSTPATFAPMDTRTCASLNTSIIAGNLWSCACQQPVPCSTGSRSAPLRCGLTPTPTPTRTTTRDTRRTEGFQAGRENSIDGPVSRM